MAGCTLLVNGGICVDWKRCDWQKKGEGKGGLMQLSHHPLLSLTTKDKKTGG